MDDIYLPSFALPSLKPISTSRLRGPSAAPNTLLHYVTLILLLRNSTAKMPQQQTPSNKTSNTSKTSDIPAPSTTSAKPTHNTPSSPYNPPTPPKRSTSTTRQKPNPLLTQNAKFLAKARKINAEKAAIRAAAEAAETQGAKTDSRSAERQLEDQLSKLTMTPAPMAVGSSGGDVKDLEKEVGTGGADGRSDKAGGVPKEGTFSWAMRLVREGERRGVDDGWVINGSDLRKGCHKMTVDLEYMD
ncbi:MAG: hypothetical protein Q9204_004991 [Flavoplaca sp. TL-2023a]